MEKLRIRNSFINDWLGQCQLATKARWFGTPQEKELMDIGHKQNIRWGSYFEQLVFGSGVGGKIIELKPNELSSKILPRVKRQAREAREYLWKELGHPFIAAQVQLFGDIEVDGILIPCEGNIDGMFGTKGIPAVNVDTKLSGDASTTWGDYAWGKPESMNMGQMVMYKTLVKLNYSVDVRSIYYVADTKESERVEVIEPVFSEWYIDDYKQKIKKVYTEATQAINFNYWVPSNDYNKCKKCPLRSICPSAVKIPTVKIVEK